MSDLTATEKNLSLTADPFHLKLISDAISDYLINNDHTDDALLSDFCYALDVEYQRHHNKSNDDFDFSDEDKEKLIPAQVLQADIKLSVDTPEILEEAQQIKIRALDKFSSKAFHKYDKGQKEHGGLITERVSIKDLEDEIIDLWFYLSALDEKLNHLD